jgi:methionyl-tRNA synthetase
MWKKCGSTLNATRFNQPKINYYRRNTYNEINETLVLPLDRYEDFLKEWILVGHKTTGNPMFTDK